MTDSQETQGQRLQFCCPDESCDKLFCSQKSLDQHVLLGNCCYKPSIVTEAAKELYAEKLYNMLPPSLAISNIKVEPCSSSTDSKGTMLHKGWALKEVKPRVLFSHSQKLYMKEKFDIGKHTGHKVDPYVASEEMKLSGNFSKEEFLTGQQIASYFSRLCQIEKRTNADDYESAVLEENKDVLRKSIKQILKS